LVSLIFMLFEIKTSTIHGTGAFALTFIKSGTKIAGYEGERISKSESARRCEQENPYIFYLNENEDIDGDSPANPARFINHSCNPNCETLMEEKRIWIQAVRDIPPGGELTFNYGYDLEAYRDHPCRCGAADCVGYIVSEEFFPQLRSKQTMTKGGG